jgi:hypothetical protein
LDREARLPLIELDGSGSTDEDGTVVTYEWSGLDGAPDPEDISRPILGLAPGAYAFSLTVTDDDGLTGTALLDLEVTRPPLEEVRSLFREELAGADTNGDSQVSFSEARAFVVFLTEEEFQTLDRGADGALTEDDLKPTKDPVGCSPGRGGKRGFAGDLVLLAGLLGILTRRILWKGQERRTSIS